jgi:hypothetical protein
MVDPRQLYKNLRFTENTNNNLKSTLMRLHPRVGRGCTQSCGAPSETEEDEERDWQREDGCGHSEFSPPLTLPSYSLCPTKSRCA